MASTGRASLSSSRSRVPARVLALAAGWCVAAAAPLMAQSTAPEKTPLEETAKQSQQPSGNQSTTTTGGPPGSAPVTAAGGVVAPPGANPSATPTVPAPRPIGENVPRRNSRPRPAAGQPATQPQGGQPQNGAPNGQPGNRPVQPGGLPGDGGQPGAAQPAAHMPEPPAEGPVRFDAFSEPVELSTLVDYIARSLGINITVKGTLSGQVVFNAPVEVDRSRLRGLLAALLEQHNFALVYDEESTFYSIVPANETGMRLGDTLSSTRVFATPNVRASTVKQVIDAQLMGGGAVGGAPVSNKVSAVDELGVLVVTETPRKLDQIGHLVEAILTEYAKNKFIRLDLKYVAAPIARERALQLVGQSSGRTGQMGVDQSQVVPQSIPGLGGSTGRLDNLGDRLTVDAQSNALVFRGLPEEVEQVERIIEVIDVPNNLIANTYFVGSAAKQIADVARGRGLGEVTQITTRQSNNNQYNSFYTGFDPNQFQNQQRQGSNVGNGGPVMVVDESTGRIFYYGTEQQQKELSTLIDQLDIESEQVVIRGYKLKNGDAEQMTELILGILQNRTPEGDGSSLLPGGNGVQQPQPSVFFPQPGMGNEELSINSDNVFVVADKANNQIMVKAPQKQQKEFQKLIDTLDLRRPQVYIEAKIVAVTTDDRLRLAFETQLINANGTGGVLNTNFGLGSFATGGQFTDRKNVATNLTGLTAAVIKSDQVPIIINALKRETDSRIISCPQLLANDNEEAEVASVDTTPIPSISRGTGGSGDVITSSGDAEAGTKLKVTPHISEAGYLRLEYDIELSSFTGEAQDSLPPPKQVNNIKSIVTLPSDATIVVGGLVLDSNTKSIVKVPLLGDIPLIGELFKDRNQGDRKTTLYIFLKPRIYSDPYFADAKLGTTGPAEASKLPDALPPLKASTIEIVETDRNKRSQ